MTAVIAAIISHLPTTVCPPRHDSRHVQKHALLCPCSSETKGGNRRNFVVFFPQIRLWLYSSSISPLRCWVPLDEGRKTSGGWRQNAQKWMEKRVEGIKGLFFCFDSYGLDFCFKWPETDFLQTKYIYKYTERKRGMTAIENRMQCGLDVKMQMYFLTFSLYACERAKSELFYFRLMMMFFMELKTLKRLLISTHKIVHRRYKNGRNKHHLCDVFFLLFVSFKLLANTSKIHIIF